jgi:CRP-like cAMP-binding protein
VNASDLARLLSSTSLFRSLTASDVRELLTKHYFPLSRYEEGRCVAFRGDPYEELCIILEGELQAGITDVEGHTLVVEVLEAPQVVASAVFFSSSRRLPVDLLARTDVVLLRIPRSELLALLHEHEAILQGLLTDMGNRLQFLAQRLRMSQFSSIRQKLAVYLTELAEQTGTTVVSTPNTRQELADIFGVARPSVSRAISELEHEGLVRTHGREFELVQPETLREVAHDVSPR